MSLRPPSPPVQWVPVAPSHGLYAAIRALPQFKLPTGAPDQLFCALNPDGTIEIADARTNVRLRFQLRGADARALLGEDHGMPEQPAADPTDRISDTFERCADIYEGETVPGACTIALRVALDSVNAESGAVLLRQDASHLGFVAAQGPCSDRVRGVTLHMLDGIAGFSTRAGASIIVDDVAQDTRHATAVDKATGYHTRSVLAVPIRTEGGESLGCIELLNAPRGFQPEDLEVARTVAAALASRLHLISA